MLIDGGRGLWTDDGLMKVEAVKAEARDLQALQFFAGCSEAQSRALAPFLRACSFPRSACLQQEGAPNPCVHFVRQGEVLLQKETRPGAEPARLSIVRPGEMFGFGEIMLRTCYTTALALTPVRTWMVERGDFMQQILAIPLLRERLLTSLSEIARILMHKVVSGDGLHELAMYLRHLAHRNGRTVRGRIRLQAEVRQPEVASVLNLSREHVTRLFARLRKEGAVSFNRGHPIIDPAWLDRMTTDRDLADSLQYRDLPHPSARQ